MITDSADRPLLDYVDEETESKTPLVKTSPRDRLKIVYIFFYLIGIATLLPWNFFITEQEYFQYKLRNTSLPGNLSFTDPSYFTYMQRTYMVFFAVSSMGPTVLFQFLNALLTTKIHVNIRVTTSIMIMILSFVLTVILAQVNSDKWQVLFLIVTLVTLVIVSASSAVFQGGAFGIAAMFPDKYTQALMGGMGFGGVFAAVCNIFVIVIGESAKDAATIFFLIAIAVLATSLTVYLMLPHVKFSLHYVRLHEERVSLSRSASRNSVQSQSENSRRSSQDEALIDPVSDDEDSSTWEVDWEMNEWSVFSRNGPVAVVFRKIWRLALTVMLIFTVTLACFPGICSRIFSVNRYNDSPWTNRYFTPLVCFLLFNVCDWAGRTIASSILLPSKNSLWLPLSGVLRIGFIPLFLYCNVLPRSNTQLVFNSDLYPIIFMLFFGVSNGYISTLCMMYAPSIVPAEHAETAGAMMSFFLAVGLGIGSLLSILIVSLV